MGNKMGNYSRKGAKTLDLDLFFDVIVSFVPEANKDAP